MSVPPALTAPDPVALPSSTVVADRVRVTVLTPRLVRLEYAADGAFEDRASLAVVNRRFPRVDFSVTRSAGRLVVDTGAVGVTVSDTTRPFRRSTLTARVGRGRSAVRWHHGARDRGNLGGTRRTLDGWKGRQRQEVVDFDVATGTVVFGEWQDQRLDPGLLSRQGWAVLDDTGTVVLDPAAGGRTARGRAWPTPRAEGRRQDLYLFGHGSDHKGALADAARLVGPQPLPPRFAFGYWYSRYYAYTDRELLEIADRFDEMGVPVDVLVVDMDWHRAGWTGYSWDRRYFPDPDDTLARLHDRGLRVSLNLHPAEGVGRHEDAFEQVCSDLGLDPRRTDRVPFDCTDPAYVDTYFRRLHHPEEDRGVDFWWMDWQQGRGSEIPGLDPLPWLNHLHWDDQARRRRDRRPLVFSRWGGIGGGRYPVGFSGDAWSVWESLAFQPEFTATAANVLFGYWSHDIGGHYGPATTAELYTRWMQFGIYSPILRTHGSKHPEQERRFWDFADPYRTIMIDAVRRRYEMVPYLYSECRRGVETGLSLVRPMYHEHPDQEAAYEAPGQYHFGDAFVVAPVTRPIDEDQMAAVSVWLPRGTWYDTAHGRSVTVREAAGRWSEGRYFLDEVPVFARAGAVVPGQRDATRLGDPSYEHLVVTGYPGADGRHDLYEDDGISQGYLEGRSVSVPLHQRIGPRVRSVRIGPATGQYRGWLRRRPVDVRLVGEPPPARVTVDDREVAWAPAADGGRDGLGAQAYWWYDAGGASVVVCLPDVDLRRGATVRLHRDPSLPRSAVRALDGYPGLARRLDALAYRTGLVSPFYELHAEERLVVDLAQAANRITREPTRLAGELRRVRRELRRLDGILAEFQEAWRTAVALPFSDPRQLSVGIVAETRRILTTTVAQFGAR